MLVEELWVPAQLYPRASSCVWGFISHVCGLRLHCRNCAVVKSQQCQVKASSLALIPWDYMAEALLLLFQPLGHGKREKDTRSLLCPSLISLTASLLQALQTESSPAPLLPSPLFSHHTNPLLWASAGPAAHSGAGGPHQSLATWTRP